MKKLSICAFAFMAMFAMSNKANAEETTVNENEETIEIKVSEDQNTVAAPSAEEVDEVVIYQRADGSVYVVHTHTMQVKK